MRTAKLQLKYVQLLQSAQIRALDAHQGDHDASGVEDWRLLATGGVETDNLRINANVMHIMQSSQRLLRMVNRLQISLALKQDGALAARVEEQRQSYEEECRRLAQEAEKIIAENPGKFES